MAIAPSEKHLEDWIVANPEWFGYYIDINNEHFFSYADKIVARQARFPSGICDLITLTNYSQPALTVVELKSGVIDEQTVVQCLRYMRDVKATLYHLIEPPFQHLEVLEYIKRMDYNKFLQVVNKSPVVNGLLVGRSIKNIGVKYACEACDIALMTYDFDGTNYQFECELEWLLWGSDVHTEFADGWLGFALFNVIEQRYTSLIRRQS